MDRVPLHFSHLHRAFALLLAVAGLGIAALTWARVVQTIFDAKPVTSTMHATSVVWGDRVFQSPAELRRWLRSHGTTYAAWRGQHVVASALLEHRPAPTVRTKPAVPRTSAAGTAPTPTRTPTVTARATVTVPATVTAT
ncbi:MAG: hypothetical protein M3O89_03760, partial [Actinomycetota bacterium]|nr:hypothetical protein [Actinomycetota bacterium]